MYQWLKPFLFSLEPEKAHAVAADSLQAIHKYLGLEKIFHTHIRDNRLNRNIFGLHFPNPVGMAAGFDKNAELVDELSLLGFGFIEIGTVTPKPQAGNERPRLFRLEKDHALVNRMGFNNDGVTTIAARLATRKGTAIVGGNIGKNKDTPNERAADDYLQCLEVLYPFVDYFVVNVSSPNTPNLRELQEREPLRRLLSSLTAAAKTMTLIKPILLKISPDITSEMLNDILEIVTATGVAGIVATNTTTSREGLRTEAEKVNSIGAGGLSGRPLFERSTLIINEIKEKAGGKIPVIGVGGIFSAIDALEKIEAGAALVQLYTGFIYKGPSLLKEINNELLKTVEKN
ncbi:MAG: quinone-dependent dihydroorotate dehydrogenase [Bacteroidia bacterium]